VPEYLDPLDGAGWRRMILDYATPDSRARAAQLARLRNWSPPAWADHFAAVNRLLEEVTARTAPAAAAASAPSASPAPAPVRRPEPAPPRRAEPVPVRRADPAPPRAPEPLVARQLGLR